MAPLTTAHDPRMLKALELVRDAGQWARITDRETGRRAYGIPAACKPGTVYLVTTTSCTCPDSEYRGTICKHQIAARLVVAASEAVDQNQPHDCEHCPRLQACSCQPRRSRAPLVGRLAV